MPPPLNCAHEAYSGRAVLVFKFFTKFFNKHL